MDKQKSKTEKLPFCIQLIFWYNLVISALFFIVGILAGFFVGGIIITIPLVLLSVFIVRILAIDFRKKKIHAYWLNFIFSGLAAISAVVSIALGSLESLGALILDGGIIYCLLRSDTRNFFFNKPKK